MEAPWKTGCSPRNEFNPDKAFPSASTFVESALLAPEASRGCCHQTSPVSSPQSHSCLKAHDQSFICSAKPFLPSSFQRCILIQDPSGHARAKCGSWGCSLGHREGVGSVPRGVGKARLGQQGPKPAWVVFQFPLGLNKAEGRALGCPCHTPKSGSESTSKSPGQHLLQGTHPALRKNRDLFCGSTFMSELFPPDPAAHLFLGKGGSQSS